MNGPDRRALLRGAAGKNGNAHHHAQQNILHIRDFRSLAAGSDLDGAAALVALFALYAIHGIAPIR